MHYIYGNCPSCDSVTYRWPTESFYRHNSDNSDATDCDRDPAWFGNSPYSRVE